MSTYPKEFKAAFDEVVNEDTISEYEDSRINWKFFFQCQKDAETKRRSTK